MYGVLNTQIGRMQYDLSTGEVLAKGVYENDSYSHPEQTVNKTDNKGLRHYYYSRDIEELEELCKYSSYDSGDLVAEHNEKLFCLLGRGLITPNNFYLFSLLSRRIQKRNVLIISKKELITILNTDSKNFSRSVARLEDSGIMKVLSPNGYRNDQINVVFHPSLVWKGDYSLRNKLERAIMASCMPWYEVLSFNSTFGID